MNASRLAPLLSSLFLLACPSPTCPPGTAGCPCREGGGCDTELTCSTALVCEGAVPTGSGVQVSDQRARGCEVVFTESAGAAIARVSFDAGVQGVFVREAPRVAASFVSAGDAPFPSGGIQLAITGPAAGIQVTRASCVDSAGARIPSVSVTVQP